jgi:hypothetical protein
MKIEATTAQNSQCFLAWLRWKDRGILSVSNHHSQASTKACSWKLQKDAWEDRKVTGLRGKLEK